MNRLLEKCIKRYERCLRCLGKTRKGKRILDGIPISYQNILFKWLKYVQNDVSSPMIFNYNILYFKNGYLQKKVVLLYNILLYLIMQPYSFLLSKQIKSQMTSIMWSTGSRVRLTWDHILTLLFSLWSINFFENLFPHLDEKNNIAS